MKEAEVDDANLMERSEVAEYQAGSNGADPETTTTQGCKCKSYCGATIDFKLFKYDWCYTGIPTENSNVRLLVIFQNDIEFYWNNIYNIFRKWMWAIFLDTPSALRLVQIFGYQQAGTFDEKLGS